MATDHFDLALLILVVSAFVMIFLVSIIMTQQMSIVKQSLQSIYDEVFGEPTDHPLIARLFAFLADLILLMAVIFSVDLAWSSSDKFSTVDPTLINLSLIVTYYTLGNSCVFKGQTIGKLLLRIRVVDYRGNYLSVVRSFLRNLLILWLLYGNYIVYLIILAERYNLYVFCMIMWAIAILGVLYFPLLKLNRQGLHDILVSSQVIPKHRMVTTERKQDWRLISGFAAIIAALLIYMLMG